MNLEQKHEIENWWNSHSQDYKDEYKSEYQGVELENLNDEDFCKYIDDLDAAFARKAYFAQNDNRLFSNLINKISSLKLSSSIFLLRKIC